MDAKALLDAGQLSAAVDAATKQVKAHPGDVSARIFLFELLAAAGQFERAQKHLDVVAEKDADMREGAVSYREVLAAEQRRARLFATGSGSLDQVVPGRPDLTSELLALQALRAGDTARAAELLAQASAGLPALGGSIDGERFDEFRDADDLLANHLEVISNGRYGWIPFRDIRTLELDAPRFFRDLLWVPTMVTLADGFAAKMFVPARYPGSEVHADDAVRLARATDWSGDEAPVRGVGQRAFLAGEDLKYILETRAIVFGA